MALDIGLEKTRHKNLAFLIEKLHMLRMQRLCNLTDIHFSDA